MESQIVRAIVKKRIKLEVMLSDFRLYYKVIVIKTTWYFHENKHIDQWDRLERPEINSHTYGQ